LGLHPPLPRAAGCRLAAAAPASAVPQTRHLRYKMTFSEKLFRPARSLPSAPLVVLMARALCLGFLRGAEGVFSTVYRFPQQMPNRQPRPPRSSACCTAAPAAPASAAPRQVVGGRGIVFFAVDFHCFHSPRNASAGHASRQCRRAAAAASQVRPAHGGSGEMVFVETVFSPLSPLLPLASPCCGSLSPRFPLLFPRSCSSGACWRPVSAGV
jgi:hypothetical protein